MRRNCAGLVSALMLGLGATACGGPSTTTTPRFPAASSGAASESANSIIDVSGATAAAPVASDSQIALHPALYADGGNPCASVTLTEFVGKADPTCAYQFAQLGSTVVPGPDVIARSTAPRSAAIQSGVDASSATAIANGFYVTDTLRAWAISLGEPKVLPALDGPVSTDDAIIIGLAGRKLKLAVIPQCSYPTNIRIAAADKDVISYFEGLGWPQPSPTAVVATYAKCAGIAITFMDGSTVSLLGHPQPISIVTTGHVATVKPFGPIFVEDGWGACGNPSLRSLCG